MTIEALGRACAGTDVTLIDALRVIDQGAHAICCLIDDDQRLVAVLTDGDARRAILSGTALTSPALPYATHSPRTVAQGTSRAHVLDVMHALRINAVPEVDHDGKLVGLHTLSEITGAEPLASTAVIMAGGKGTRLGDLTRATPKPLMTVAGRPIIEWIILGLVGDGVRQVYVSVNHMADQIIERLGDGSTLGCRIDYLQETPDNPLGTAGSLTLLPDELVKPHQPPIIVMNGDLMVEYDAQALLRSHAAAGSALTIGTRAYNHTVPFGVVEINDRLQVTDIVEKPELTVQINAAVYCVDSELVRLLPYNRPSTMPELAQICLDTARPVAAWPINSEWIDVGTPADLARAKGH